MKKSVLLSCFLFLLTTCIAQDDKISSLKEKLHSYNTYPEILQTHIEIGQAYRVQAIYLDSAIVYFKKALDLALKNNLEEKKTEIYYRIAHTYGIAESWENSALFFNKAIPHFLEHKNYERLANTYNNLGILYLKSKDYKTAENYFNQAIQTAIINNKELSLSESYIYLAEIKLHQNKFYEAQKYLENLNGITINPYSKLTKPLISAKVNMRLGKLDLALEQALEAKQLALNQLDLDHSLQSSQVLHNIYEKLGDYKSANSALKEVLTLKDSILKSKQINEIEKMELKMQLKSQQEINEDLEKQNYYRYLIYIAFSLASVLFILLILRQVKIRKMTSEIYSIQKKLISSELETRNKQATTMDAAKSADSELKNNGKQQ